MTLQAPFKPFILIPLLLIALSFSCGNRSAGTTKLSDAKQSGLLTEQQFNALFPNRDRFYTYKAFMQAIDEMAAIKIKITRRAYQALQMARTDKKTGKTTVTRQDEGFNEDWARSKPDSVYYIDYGLFCNEKDAAINKREVAAFFAHIAHETRHGINGKYNDGLMLKTEADTTLPYVVPNDEYPPVKGKKYYGRGPLQLSYNGNYGYASHCIFGNKETLLNNPELIEQDAVVAFKTAIYFWMTPQSPKPSAHDAICGKWQPATTEKAKGRVPGFGSTINIVNGAVECGKGDGQTNMQDRIGFYRHFLKQLGAADNNCACSCGSMQAYAY
ncbi:chitinase [Mucilaginibacter sp. UR6-1]|uniref:chitinase n=1 Tax=Mucilaginibacter sp. UR6-1 TaxID=1435643 RepID=UPI001E631EDC|nr:chitinase [Mucilaginibacter sp. UR6-1]MCC8407302.1 chitinase [Mucilaginibacter sp. UR6-1]